MSFALIGLHVFYLDMGGIWGYIFILFFKCEEEIPQIVENGILTITANKNYEVV